MYPFAGLLFLSDILCLCQTCANLQAINAAHTPPQTQVSSFQSAEPVQPFTTVKNMGYNEAE